MKAIKAFVLAIFILGIHFSQVQAQSFTVKSYKLIVKGTSSLHEWESTVEKLESKGSLVLANNALTDVRDVVVRIPVKAIKSAKGNLMDNKTYDAFDAEKNPEIIFTLTEKKISVASKTLDASGTLAMAGATKPIDITLTYKLLSGGELQITGSKKLLMTDFKMKPPTAMMGTIKVGNEVVVTFEMVLSLNNTLSSQKLK